MLLIYGDENGWETMSDADRGRVMKDYRELHRGAALVRRDGRRRRAPADVERDDGAGP